MTGPLRVARGLLSSSLVNTTRLLLPLGALVVALCPASRADACSPPLPELAATLPADGDTVPTNPVMALAWRYGRIQYRATYRVEGSTTSMDLGVVPDELWGPGIPTLTLPEGAPGTRATVELRDVAEFSEDVQVSFTYGDARDTAAPPTPAAPVLSLEYQEGLDDEFSSCGGLSEGTFVYAARPADLDPEIAVYAVFSSDVEDLERSVAAYHLATDTDVDRFGVGFFSEPTEVCAYARTMDRAGNWSEPSLDSCTLVEGGGCRSVQGSLPSLGALLIGLFAAGALRRRRAP